MHTKINQIIDSMASVVLGKEEQIRLSLVCLLARGHLLLEDLPGMGKTTLSQTLSKVLGLDYQRIQFTSDILPGDILGGAMFNQHTQQFDFHKGPIFTEIVLADEINRATPKSQSALLEAMEERQVTLDGKTHALPQQFFVIATQNPNTTSSGTFPLPESQLDRFLMRISLGYPAKDAEFSMLKGVNPRSLIAGINSLITKTQLGQIQDVVKTIHASDAVIDYILRIAIATRSNAQFSLGLSPRGTLALLSASRAYALIMKRNYVIPDDVQAVMHAVCAHRLKDAASSSKDGSELVAWLIKNVPAIVG